MSELWLNYTDADGSRRRVALGRPEIVIGRHSDCDVAIPDSRLSRRHARIARSNGGFTIEDLRSSNGTDLNGEPVFEPVALRGGDRISFGGVAAVVENEAPEPVAAPVATAPAKPAAPAAVTAAAKEESNAGGGIPLWLIVAVPAMAAVLVVVAGIAIMLLLRSPADVSANEIDPDDPIISTDKDPEKKGLDKDDTPDSDKPANNSIVADDPNDAGPTPTPANLSDTAKVEINAASFLRKIAQNNPKAFVTGEQAKRIGTKVKQLSSSSALADNIKSAKSNSAQIKTLAAAKNLKPQMLAVAAIAKLGGTRGDVLATATSMAEVLDKLTIQLGNELADDCVLTIAVYDQGVAGDTMKMRNMLQELANKSSESSRTIRTIWFLQKEGKISPGQFDMALTFLAAGTIAQNPKEFGVNAEALDL